MLLGIAATGLTAEYVHAAPVVPGMGITQLHVGTADWHLPIYHYDDYDNWEVMQYYDISRRYEIPSDDARAVTSEKADEIYYSEPYHPVLWGR